MRVTVLAALLLALAVAVNPAASPQTSQAAAAQAEKLPPISYTCPMHPEILESKGGICPICKMDLVPIRLDSVWTCGTKPLAVVRDAPGRCPIDGTALVQVTADSHCAMGLHGTHAEPSAVRK